MSILFPLSPPPHTHTFPVRGQGPYNGSCQQLEDIKHIQVGPAVLTMHEKNADTDTDNIGLLVNDIGVHCHVPFHHIF